MSRVTPYSPFVRLVLAPNPSPMTLEGTNTYVLGRERTIVIDPGPADEGHLDRVAQEAGRPELILLTHWHPDHAEGAARLAEKTGAPIASAAGSREETIAVADGEEIAAGDSVLRAIATPGHASDHLCFLLPDEKALFTGDHILGFGTTVVAYPDGDMERYLRSLERLREEDVKRMYPGHGPVIDTPAEVLDYYIQHRLEREQQVLDALDAERTVEELVEEIYVDVDRVLHPIAAMTVKAHLAKLEREGHAKEAAGRWSRG